MRSIGHFIQSRLFVGMALTMMLGAILLAAAMRFLDIREFDAALTTKARTLSTLIFQHPNAIEVDFADEFLPEFERENDTEYYQVRLMDGAVVQRSDKLGDADLPILLDHPGEKVLHNLTLPDGRRGRMVQIAVAPRTDKRAIDEDESDLFPLPVNLDTHRPYVLLTVAWGRQQLDTVLWTVYTIVLVIMALLIIMLMLVARKFLRLGFHPIENMNRQIRELGPKSLDRRVRLVETPAELEPALVALNGFLDDLQKAFVREQRFTNNVAHELRTPVAELRLASEVGIKWPNDPELVRKRFEEIRELAISMEWKVNGLLELSRLDNQTTTIQRTEIPLRDFIDAIWRKMQDGHNPSGLILVNNIPDTVTILSDEVRLDMIIHNLMQNALSYSRVSTELIVGGQKESDGKFTMTLSNQSDHLEKQDMEHIFDRFWRKDASRSDHRRLGLGLSITKALTELLGIDLAAELTPDHLFIVRLSFPA